MMTRNEENGRVENNPYHNPVLRRWLDPLTEAIEAELDSTGRPGRRGAHVALLRPLDPRSVAFYAIRGILAVVVGGNNLLRHAANDIGKVLYHELVLNTFELQSPELFWQVSQDLDKRRSKNTRHRYTTLRMQATGADVPLPVWAAEDRDQVGHCLIELMRVLGMVDVVMRREVRYRKHSTVYDVFLAPDLAAMVDNTRESVALAMPYNQPCIEPPRDWTALNRGGYHTARMQRQLPRFVNLFRSTPEARAAVATADLSKVMSAINTLQRVKWQVNPDILEALQVIGKRMDLDEIVPEDVGDKPDAPHWLTPDLSKDAMTPEQAAAFTDWKRRMRDWYEKRKLNGIRWGRMVSALAMATKYGPDMGYRPIYFVYQADFRGRLYAMTNGISPQGSDLQKALLRFHEGKPLDTPEAVMWFKVGGTSKWGFDKASFADRVKWVDERREQIIECALHPTNGGLWLEADKPLQFLAWCFEYEAWTRRGDKFLSHLPIGFDGSCNGLQHFSAMLRDDIGGKAVNLLDAELPNDIYQQVANVTAERLRTMNTANLDEQQQRFRSAWLDHGITRKLVKRSVMTLPYGSTRYSCSDFIVDDYLKHGLVHGVDPKEFRAMATFLSHHVWQSIGDVVIAARQGMDWLQACAGSIIKAGANHISWTSPSGFPAVQVYNEVEVTQVRTLLLGGSVKIKVGREGAKPDIDRHKNGIAPNFVHSMDAAHLVLTTNACEDAGISALAMIHDDYGTHAADAQRLYELIRKTFVEMYDQHDPIAAFAARYGDLPEAPQSGALDVHQVLQSRFFFA